VGRHILQAMRDLDDPDPSRLKCKVGLEPCGFCGQDECITTLKFTKDGNPRLPTNCPYHYEGMHYTEPVNTSKKVKCTNTPIHCSLC
ncbi:hypothetical protein C8J55DRAFT_404414, partial [Lentinula edodes]